MATRKHADLIYDVGFHRGEDTSFYLRKGFRVVAFEALPELVDEGRVLFAQEIACGRLTMVAGAIAPPEMVTPAGTVRFFKNEQDSVWGTVNPSWALRNERLGTSNTSLEVPAIDFAEVMRIHGVPRYLKIDIEGSDLLCLRALGGFEERPDYVSIESSKTSWAEMRAEVRLFQSLGYRRFQAVEQSGVPCQVAPLPAREGVFVEQRFPFGASGLFGAELPGRWLTGAELLRKYAAIRLGYILLGDEGVLASWRFRGASRLRTLVVGVLRCFTGAAVPGWYDTHARLAP